MKKFSEWFWEVIKWWDNAGDEAREYFINELNKRDRKKLCYETDNKMLDYTCCVDFSNDIDLLGDKVVYIYVNPNGIPYYVGKGNSYRPVDLHSRSAVFKKEYLRDNCAKVFIMASNVLDYYAEEIETLCIWTMLKKNWELLNIRKIEIDEEKYLEYIEQYPDITKVLDCLNSKCISAILHDGFLDTNMISTRLNKDSRYRSKNIWEIDGEIKTATQWCKEYGENLSGTLRRIVTYHLTPKEALTFPKTTHKPANMTLQQYWNRHGYYPGTDTTSRVISINYNGYYDMDLDYLLSSENC